MNYDRFAKIYDITCTGVEGDVEFFLKEAKRADQILEVGCGTGRIMLPILKAGNNILGIDSSAEMINSLSLKANKLGLEANTIHIDVEKLKLDKNFDLIILAYRTFMHFYEANNQLVILENLKNMLSPKGKIVIDLFNPSLSRIVNPQNGYFLIDEQKQENITKLIWLSERFDISNQLVYNLFKVETFNRLGELKNTIVEKFKARWFYPSEFHNLVQAAGLKIKSVNSDYFENEFTGAEDYMIWKLERK